MASRIVKAPAVQARRTFAAQVKIKKHLWRTGKFDGNLFDRNMKKENFFQSLNFTQAAVAQTERELVKAEPLKISTVKVMISAKAQNCCQIKVAAWS